MTQRIATLVPCEVAAAFAVVERHRFIPAIFESSDGGAVRPRSRRQPGATVSRRALDPWSEADMTTAYSDRALCTRVGDDGEVLSTTSQPSLIAQMLHHLALEPGHRVLEVGAGVGYTAALIDHLVGETGRVLSIDLDESVVLWAAQVCATVAPRVEVRAADGFAGAPDDAPFDRLIATVGCPDMSPAWTEQVVDGAVAVVPLQHGARWAPVFRLVHDGRRWSGVPVCPSGFISLRGPAAVVPPPGRGRRTVDFGGFVALPAAALAALRTSGLGRERALGLAHFVGFSSPESSWDLTVERDGAVAWLDLDAGRISHTGGAEGAAAAAEAAGLVERWLDLGAPGLDRFRSTFVRHEDLSESDERDIVAVLDRPHHRQLVRVTPSAEK